MLVLLQATMVTHFCIFLFLVIIFLVGEIYLTSKNARNANGKTPLDFARENGCMEIVEFLEENGRKRNEENVQRNIREEDRSSLINTRTRRSMEDNLFNWAKEMRERLVANRLYGNATEKLEGSKQLEKSLSFTTPNISQSGRPSVESSIHSIKHEHHK